MFYTEMTIMGLNTLSDVAHVHRKILQALHSYLNRDTSVSIGIDFPDWQIKQEKHKTDGALAGNRIRFFGQAGNLQDWLTFIDKVVPHWFENGVLVVSDVKAIPQGVTEWVSVVRTRNNERRTPGDLARRERRWALRHPGMALPDLRTHRTIEPDYFVVLESSSTRVQEGVVQSFKLHMKRTVVSAAPDLTANRYGLGAAVPYWA